MVATPASPGVQPTVNEIVPRRDGHYTHALNVVCDGLAGNTADITFNQPARGVLVPSSSLLVVVTAAGVNLQLATTTSDMFFPLAIKGVIRSAQTLVSNQPVVFFW